ncbi:MAG: ATP-binding cassette domain-containing protein [Oscillatoriales cyanobacterium SM2_2_1]|nr:ATP-binding cassette domain-containing protein [Oscillatoriales cyanobacterium SM2_2_1]
MTSSPTVKISNLCHYYGEGDLRKQVLFDISLTIPPGQIVILMGPSGSGKTTLLTLIGALRSLQQGSLQVLGQELAGSSKQKLVQLRQKIGFIFQSHNLFFALTARQNVMLSTDMHPQRGDRERAAEILARLGLKERIDYHPHALSGGQRQRVAIARALVNQPPLILADEPTAALDRQTGRDVVTLMRQMAEEQGTTVLMVTHDNRILDVADRVINLVDGALEFDVSPLELLSGATATGAGHWSPPQTAAAPTFPPLGVTADSLGA